MDCQKREKCHISVARRGPGDTAPSILGSVFSSIINKVGIVAGVSTLFEEGPKHSVQHWTVSLYPSTGRLWIFGSMPDGCFLGLVAP